MWSKKKPIPDLGDENTPIEEVRKFYKFWDNFESWREFSQYDEYDVTEAGDRYERRYMENENKNERKKHTKIERARLIKLVEISYRKDPRIRKELEFIEAEKQRVKDEKKAVKAARFEAKREVERMELEEKARVVEEAKEVTRLA